MPAYDALLLISFGGPEKPDDVIPFLENVLRGRNVPRDRLEVVAEHYYHFGGRSPINDQNRALITALQAAEIGMPIYWGNRNWHPFLEDTMTQMTAAGVRRVLALATSAFGSYSGCRQYIEDIARTRGPLVVDKIPPFSAHAGFIEAQIARVQEALAQLPDAELFFTAHSIPRLLADRSPYVDQLNAACRRVADELGRASYRLAYQSRSGPPSQPWLEPDISDALRESRPHAAVIVPIGFLSDHMEVIYDLDVLARDTCKELGIPMARAGTVETHPRFVQGIVEMIREYSEKPPVACAADCCPGR